MQNIVNKTEREHILVCLSPSPSNERIVRMAGNMAQAFCGSFTALYVQTPGYASMNAEDTVRIPRKGDKGISIRLGRKTSPRPLHKIRAHRNDRLRRRKHFENQRNGFRG